MKNLYQSKVIGTRVIESRLKSDEQIELNAGASLFELTLIDNFDGRGLKRCSIPGCGAYFGRRKAVADFWRDQKSDVLIRLSSTHQEHSYLCRMKSGTHLSEARLPALEEYVTDLLIEWLGDCIDEPPWINY